MVEETAQSGQRMTVARGEELGRADSRGTLHSEVHVRFRGRLTMMSHPFEVPLHCSASKVARRYEGIDDPKQAKNAIEQWVYSCEVIATIPRSRDSSWIANSHVKSCIKFHQNFSFNVFSCAWKVLLRTTGVYPGGDGLQWGRSGRNRETTAGSVRFASPKSRQKWFPRRDDFRHQLCLPSYWIRRGSFWEAKKQNKKKKNTHQVRQTTFTSFRLFCRSTPQRNYSMLMEHAMFFSFALCLNSCNFRTEQCSTWSSRLMRSVSAFSSAHQRSMYQSRKVIFGDKQIIQLRLSKSHSMQVYTELVD